MKHLTINSTPAISKNFAGFLVLCEKFEMDMVLYRLTNLNSLFFYITTKTGQSHYIDIFFDDDFKEAEDEAAIAIYVGTKLLARFVKMEDYVNFLENGK